MADTHAVATEHPPQLRHHFDDMDQQFDSATFGMWVFLLTEIMFFGGMFGAYTVYRSMYPEAFAATSNFMNPAFGAANTAVLIVSSLTMALAVRAAHLGQQKAPAIDAGAHHDFRHRVPGDQGLRISRALGRQMKVPLFAGHWAWDGPLAPPQYAHQAQILFCFYFLHDRIPRRPHDCGPGYHDHDSLMARKGTFGPEYYTPVEVSGLYWHFVDIVWIFLFPLLYLIGHTKNLYLICIQSLPFEPTS